jgi:hypothetical protein
MSRPPPDFFLQSTNPQGAQIMNTNSLSRVKSTAIAANLAALNDLLITAAERSAEAQELAQNGECNSAIGAILELDSILDDAKTLYGAALALHRTKGF